MKQIAIVLILSGLAIFILAFIGSILSFIGEHPILGLGLVAIIAGVILLIVNIYQETEKAKESEPFRGIEK